MKHFKEDYIYTVTYKFSDETTATICAFKKKEDAEELVKEIREKKALGDDVIDGFVDRIGLYHEDI